MSNKEEKRNSTHIFDGRFANVSPSPSVQVPCEFGLASTGVLGLDIVGELGTTDVLLSSLVMRICNAWFLSRTASLAAFCLRWCCEAFRLICATSAASPMIVLDRDRRLVSTSGSGSTMTAGRGLATSKYPTVGLVKVCPVSIC